MIHTLPTPLALCALAMVVSGSAVAAQTFSFPSLTSERSVGQPVSPQPLLAQEDQGRKDPFVAAGLEVVLPILGHAYAGNAKRGILPNAVSLGGLVGMAARIDIFGEPDTLDYVLAAAFLGGRGLGNRIGGQNGQRPQPIPFVRQREPSLFPTPAGRLGVGMRLRAG